MARTFTVRRNDSQSMVQSRCIDMDMPSVEKLAPKYDVYNLRNCQAGYLHIRDLGIIVLLHVASQSGEHHTARMSIVTGRAPQEAIKCCPAGIFGEESNERPGKLTGAS